METYEPYPDIPYITAKQIWPDGYMINWWEKKNDKQEIQPSNNRTRSNMP